MGRKKKYKKTGRTEERDFLSVTECAQSFAVDRKSILNWIHKGMLKAYTTAGGRFRIMKSEVENLKKLTGLKDKVKRILVLDDEKMVLDTMTQYLEQLYHERVKIFCNQSAIQGIIQMGDIRPDLLILDIRIPDMDGFKVIEELKKTKQEIKVLIISGFLDEANMTKLKNIGVSDYIEKPLDIWSLKAKVDNLLMMI